MKLSSKARYGLKAMCYMAQHYGDKVISLSVMSSDLGLSDKYLEQLLSSLRKAGLVDANRGANGGYFLAKTPDNISVGDVLRVLEDGLVIIDCLSGRSDNKCKCSTEQGEGACSCSSDGECGEKCSCSTYEVWNKLYIAINECLDGMSLSDLIAKEV